MATPANATALAGFIFVAFPRSYWAHLSGPAVYALSRRDPATGRVVLLYVGQCEELKRHIGPEHDKWEAANAFGMTEILVLRMESKHRRCNIEMLLKQMVRPLNKSTVPHRCRGVGSGVMFTLTAYETKRWPDGKIPGGKG